MQKDMKRKVQKDIILLRGFEPRILDSKSRVLTTTLQENQAVSVCDKYKVYIDCNCFQPPDSNSSSLFSGEVETEKLGTSPARKRGTGSVSSGGL